jgi:hypothetical protein
MANKTAVDWESVERAYRVGQDTLEEIGAAHGISKGRISQVAKKSGWDRDLSVRIRIKAEAKLNAEAINAELNKESKRLSDNEIVESASTTVANVQLSHRADIKRLRTRAAAYEQELDGCADEDLAKRVRILRDLKDCTCSLIAAEREAFGMDKGDQTGADAVVQIVRRIVG